MQQISAQDLKTQLDNGDTPVILDIREDWEYDICRIDPCIHINMSSLPGRLDELNRDDEIIVLCHHGARSMQVASYLESQGFKNISNLAGGIHDWANHVDPSMEQY